MFPCQTNEINKLNIGAEGARTTRGSKVKLKETESGFIVVTCIGLTKKLCLIISRNNINTQALINYYKGQ